MSVVLYALGAGLVVWGGYMLLAGDSFAALDIAANLAGWGVFAIGLGAIVGALARLARALEASSRPRRMARPAAGGFMATLRPEGAGPSVRPATSAPAAPRPEPVPAFEPSPRVERPSRAEPRAAFERAPVLAPAPRFEPVVESPAREPEIEPAPEPVTAPAEPKGRALEPEPPVAEVDEAPVVEVAPETDDEGPESGLSKRERRQRRREQKAREEAESFERPEVVAPQLGGGRRMFGGPEGDRRALDRPGPVAPPIERAARPAAARAAEPEEPVTADPVPADPIPAAPVDLAPPIRSEPEQSAPEPQVGKAEVPEPRSSDFKPSEPKVPDWLARARARREAKAGGDLPAPAVAPVIEPVEEPVQSVAEARETEAPVAAEPQIAEPAADEPPAAELTASHKDIPDEPAAPEAPVVEPETPEAAAPAGPSLVREGEHRGVTYRFYDDGSVEAHSPHGVRRFATVDELRATVIAARGPGYAEQEPEPQAEEPAPAAEPEAETRHDDPLEAALSELEGGEDRDAAARKA